MEDLSLHILDIVENAVRAGGKKIMIELLEDQSNDKLTLSIEDDGKGMDKETVSKIFDTFFTTKFMGHGLGMAAVSPIEVPSLVCVAHARLPVRRGAYE